MTNPNDAAFAKSAFYQTDTSEKGLTKREYFATLMMQALLSRSSLSGFTPQQYAQGGLQYADALIEELNKPEDGKETK